MRDLIDRQAAIDGIESFRPIKPTRGETSMEAVNRSAWECAINCVESFVRTMPPSAQPEIIRCKDCRYSIDEYEDGECYCKRPSRELVWIGKRWDFFCAAARLKMEVEHETD